MDQALDKPLERTVPCVKCGAPAAATMSYHYEDKRVWLDDLVAPPAPGVHYALCERHAGRLTPPVGWALTDRRAPERPLFLTLEVA